jgi:hypothetical protein
VELCQTKLPDSEGGGIAGGYVASVRVYLEERVMTMLIILNRLRLFGGNFLDEIPINKRGRYYKRRKSVSRRQHDGGFTVNYIRLLFEAEKPVRWS